MKGTGTCQECQRAPSQLLCPGSDVRCQVSWGSVGGTIEMFLALDTLTKAVGGTTSML